MILPSVLIACLVFDTLASALPNPTWSPWESDNVKGSAGCGKLHASGYHDASPKNTIISGGRNRTFGIYIPQGYNDSPSKPRNLVLDYHGNNGTPQQQYNNSRYFDDPEGETYIGVYPAGVDKSWQSAPYAEEGVDDLQFTADLLSYIESQYCVDSNRVYASGKSNGGGFVDFLACSDTGDKFAAFGMAAAAMYSDNAVGQCGGGRPRAILEAHGKNDTTISYYGGERNNGTLPDIRTWVGWWAERDGCDADADAAVSGDLGGYETVSYSCDGLTDVVQHYAIYDLGHCWPSDDGKNSDSSRAYCYDRSLDFTSVVVDFFGRWTVDST